jgi:ubiquinone/menaquinone biosynthesis C-methylase UbiE
MTDASFWDKAAPKYAKDPINDMAGYTQTRDRIAQILQPHHSVLELGCGTGSTALELAGGVDRYIGTDVSPQMIAIANAKLTDQSPKQLSFAVQDAGSVPSGTHDVILALNLLHLLPNLQDVLTQIYQALPPGGVFIAKTGLLKDGLWVLPWIIPVLRLVGKAPYVRSLRQADLLEMMATVGFSVPETLVQGGVVPRLFTVARKP